MKAPCFQLAGKVLPGSAAATALTSTSGKGVGVMTTGGGALLALPPPPPQAASAAAVVRASALVDVAKLLHPSSEILLSIRLFAVKMNQAKLGNVVLLLEEIWRLACP